LDGEVVRHAADEVVALVVEKVALDGELVVELSVVVALDGAELVVVLNAVLVVELGVLLRELDTRVEEEVGLVEVVVVVDTK
jgi:hypothetical protein